MAQITGQISLAYGTNPTDALKHKFATGPSEIWDETLGASTAYFINGVDKPDANHGVRLSAPFRTSPRVNGGRLGYHLEGGESLYIIVRARSQATADIVGGLSSVFFFQVAIYDALTGEFKDTRTYEYADVYTTAPQGFSADPVCPASRDQVVCAFPPLAAGEVGVLFGITRCLIDTA